MLVPVVLASDSMLLSGLSDLVRASIVSGSTDFFVSGVVKDWDEVEAGSFCGLEGLLASSAYLAFSSAFFSSTIFFYSSSI